MVKRSLTAAACSSTSEPAEKQRRYTTRARRSENSATPESPTTSGTSQGALSPASDVSSVHEAEAGIKYCRLHSEEFSTGGAPLTSTAAAHDIAQAVPEGSLSPVDMGSLAASSSYDGKFSFKGAQAQTRAHTPTYRHRHHDAPTKDDVEPIEPQSPGQGVGGDYTSQARVANGRASSAPSANIGEQPVLERSRASPAGPQTHSAPVPVPAPVPAPAHARAYCSVCKEVCCAHYPRYPAEIVDVVRQPNGAMAVQVVPRAIVVDALAIRNQADQALVGHFIRRKYGYRAWETEQMRIQVRDDIERDMQRLRDSQQHQMMECAECVHYRQWLQQWRVQYHHVSLQQQQLQQLQIFLAYQ